MSLVLNTNVNAINSQNALSKSQMSLSQAMQRLSSGLRINSAADDAAGLAIATRMTTQVNGLTQGAQNANDGISLAQTAEGALSELNNNLQAIRTLAVESANATNSASDRAAIDQEVQQRLQEVDRIATQTTFNGQHVLDGTLGSATFQVGANVGETIGISLNTSMKTSSIGSLASTATAGSLATLFGISSTGYTLATGGLTVNGTSVAAATYTTSAALATAINAAAGSTIAAANGNEINFTNSTGSAITFGGTNNQLGISTVAAATVVPSGLNLTAGQFTVNGNSVTGNFATSAALASAINTAAGSTIATSGASNTITWSNSTTSAVTFGGSANPLAGMTTLAAGTVVPPGLTLTAGQFTVNGSNVTGNFTSSAALASAINAAAGTTVATSGASNTITWSNTTGSAITFGGSANPLGSLTTVAAATLPSFTAGASGVFSIQVGSGTATDIAAGSYSSDTALVAAINTAANTSAGTSGVTYASLVSGKLVLADDTTNNITVTGSLKATFGITDVTAGGGNETSTNNVATALTGGGPGTATASDVNTAVTAAGSTTPGTHAASDVNTAVTATGSTVNGTATSTGVNAAEHVVSGTSTPLTLGSGDFTIQSGTAAAIDMAGTYDTAQDLADAINSKVSGMYASIDSTGALNLSTASTFTVAGTKAGIGTGDLGFASAGAAIAVAGSLRGTDVLTVDDSNNMIQRIDSALTAVNNYNSVLGAIQNRFQSTINSASAAAQNITAARSRIQDADFAAETTKMTSANILQQAGVSVLAQANSSQQSILKLLQ